MFCKKCGKEMNDNEKVCSNCGYSEENNSTEINETPTIGILSIVFGALGGWLGLVLAIVGLCTYKKKENRTKCYIGMGLFIAWVILYIILLAIIK